MRVIHVHVCANVLLTAPHAVRGRPASAPALTSVPTTPDSMHRYFATKTSTGKTLYKILISVLGSLQLQSIVRSVLARASWARLGLYTHMTHRWVIGMNRKIRATALGHSGGKEERRQAQSCLEYALICCVYKLA